MIPHIQGVAGTSAIVASDQGTVNGFLAVEQDGTVRFRGGTPWAPVDQPDQIEVIGAAMRHQVEAHKRGSEH